MTVETKHVSDHAGDCVPWCPACAAIETVCTKREDGLHCECWYDGEVCCSCCDPAEDEPGALGKP